MIVQPRRLPCWCRTYSLRTRRAQWTRPGLRGQPWIRRQMKVCGTFIDKIKKDCLKIKCHGIFGHMFFLQRFSLVPVTVPTGTYFSILNIRNFITFFFSRICQDGPLMITRYRTPASQSRTVIRLISVSNLRIFHRMSTEIGIDETKQIQALYY